MSDLRGRDFLRFFAGSPLLLSAACGPDADTWTGQTGIAPADVPEGELLTRAADAINVFDFEPVARSKSSLPNTPTSRWGSRTSSRCGPSARPLGASRCGRGAW